MEQSKFYQIKNVTEHEYTLVGCDGSVITRPIQDVDKLASIFTIKDAKDGDILASKSGDKIFSYRGYLDLRGNPCAYYGIYKVHDGICFSPCAIGNSFTWEEVFPATKEQRKILFEERTAAGGVLHFSKKELKKIEDEIEIPFGAKDSELQEDTYYIPKGFYAEIDDDKVVIKKGEKPTEWSEEDEGILDEIIDFLENGTVKLQHDLSLYASWLKSLKNRVQPQLKQEWSDEDENIKEWIMSDINKLLALNRKSFVIADKEIIWLKSLRSQNTWKPSDAQMIVLNDIIINGHLSNANERILKGLQEQLKKLK